MYFLGWCLWAVFLGWCLWAVCVLNLVAVIIFTIGIGPENRAESQAPSGCLTEEEYASERAMTKEPDCGSRMHIVVA